MPYLVSASLIWAFSFGLIKSQTSGLDPFVLGAIRTGIAALFFLPWFLKKSEFAISRQTYLRAAVCGSIQIGLMYGPYLLSFQYLKSFEVALFTMTTPVVMAILIAIGHKHLSFSVLFACLLATIGGVIAAGGSVSTTDIWRGLALVQLSNLLFAGGLLLWNRWIIQDEQRQARLMFPFFVGAFLASTILYFIFGKSMRPLTTNEWLVAAYLGVIASGLGFFLWNKGALRVAPAVLGTANNLKLPIAVIVSLTIFGERADLMKLVVGSGLIVFAIKMASKHASQPKAR